MSLSIWDDPLVPRAAGAPAACQRLATRATLLALLLAPSSPATAQPSGSDRLLAVAANAGIAALTSGIVALAQGRSVSRASLGGGLGGLVAGGGKVLTSARPAEAGIVGRQLAAAGSSITRNAALGQPLLGSIDLPVGPLWVSLRIPSVAITSLQVDLDQVAWAVYGFSHREYSLDWGLSWRAGAFVFISPDDVVGDDPNQIVRGRAGSGSVFISGIRLAEDPLVLSHELVHVSQVDQLKILAGHPMEDAVAEGLSRPSGQLIRGLQLSVAHYPFQWLLTPILEAEADLLEEGRDD